MAGWDEFKNDASKIISKAAVKAGEITDAMTASVRIQGIKLRLCEEYERLGRLAYKENRKNIDTSTESEEVMTKIDKLRADLKQAERDMNARREAAERREREKAEDRGDDVGKTDAADEAKTTGETASAESV